MCCHAIMIHMYVVWSVGVHGSSYEFKFVDLSRFYFWAFQLMFNVSIAIFLLLPLD